MRSRLRRALIVTPVTWTNGREHKVLGCEWGAESALACRPGLVQAPRWPLRMFLAGRLTCG